MWLWMGVLLSVIASAVRALNVGYRTETYIASALSHLPLIYKMENYEYLFYNICHLLIDLIGIYRHWRMGSGGAAIKKTLKKNVKKNSK